MKKLIFSIVCMLLVSGCNTPQSHKIAPQTNTKQYQIDGSWRVDGIEERGQYIKAKSDEDVVLVFEDSGLKVLVSGESIEKIRRTGLAKTTHAIRNHKLILQDTNREKFEADIDFFGPESFRLSNYTATKKMGAVFMAIRAALTGKLVEENNDWRMHSHLYFKKVESANPTTMEYTIWQSGKVKPAAGGKYLANGFNLEITPEGLVYDKKTGLMWAPADNGAPTKWNAAEAYCRNYRGGGYDDWRVPTLKELSTLYNKDVGYNAQGHQYSVHLPEPVKLSGGWVVASETFGLSSGYVFSFVDGGQTYGYKTAKHKDVRILPVRLSSTMSESNKSTTGEDVVGAAAFGVEIVNLLNIISSF